MSRTGATAALLLGVLTTVLVAGCVEPARRTGLSVTVVGVDGAAWRVIDPLLARGELPNLARLVAGGIRGPLRSQLPLISPPVWTSVASGLWIGITFSIAPSVIPQWHIWRSLN